MEIRTALVTDSIARAERLGISVPAACSNLPPADADVEVDVIEIDGETLIVFSWSRCTPAARAYPTEAELAR